MAHILSVDDSTDPATFMHPVMRAHGHTVDEAFDGEEGLRLARLYPYDVVVANLSMPRMGGDRMLGAVPMRASGLPVRVLQSCGPGFDHVDRRGLDFAFLVTGHWEHFLSPVQAAIDLAGARAKASVVRSMSPLTERMNLAPQRVDGHERHTIDSASTARRQSAEAQLQRTVRVRGAPPREVRWFQGPRSACRYLLEEFTDCMNVARRDVPDPGSGHPLRMALTRNNPAVDPRCLGLAPTWAAVERMVLGGSLGPLGAERDASLEALLAHAYRGIGIAEPRWGGAMLEVRDPRPTNPVGLHQIWWWILEDGAVVAADPPQSLALDRGGAPHSTTGPAIQYLDGFDVYALHGRSVDAEVIEHPERLTIDTIRACTDAELRRALRELYGDVRYLTDTGAKLIHMDTVPVDALAPGSASLTRALFEDDEGHRFLVSSDGSTSRVYYMRVPRSCTTCAEAYTALSGHPGVKTILEA